MTFAEVYTQSYMLANVPQVSRDVDAEDVVAGDRDEKCQQHHLPSGSREVYPRKRKSKRMRVVGETSCSYH
jgi:hypothetical protein